MLLLCAFALFFTLFLTLFCFTLFGMVTLFFALILLLLLLLFVFAFVFVFVRAWEDVVGRCCGRYRMRGAVWGEGEPTHTHTHRERERESV